MGARRDWELRDVVHCLAATHQRAAVVYEEMYAASATAAAVRLLARLSCRERRLEQATVAIEQRLDYGLAVRRPTFNLAAPDALPVHIDTEVVISQAAYVEAAVEKLLQAATAPPVSAPVIVAELVALHQRELFDLGVVADRLRETLG